MGGTGDRRSWAGDGKEARNGGISGVCKTPETSCTRVCVHEKERRVRAASAPAGGACQELSLGSQSGSVTTSSP